MERRHTPRAVVRLACTLQRRQGSPIAAETLDVGPTGMRIASPRPLRVDEVLAFELPVAVGAARVVRQQGLQTYALRFENLPPEARERLEALSLAA